MFGKKKHEQIVDDYNNDDDFEHDEPKQYGGGFKGSSLKSNFSAAPATSNKSSPTESAEQQKKKPNAVGHLFKKHIMLGKQAVLQGLGRVDEVVYPDDFLYHNVIVKDAFHHYRDVNATGKKCVKSSVSLSHEENILGDYLVGFAKQLSHNDKEFVDVKLIRESGMALITLASLRDQLHDAYASEFLHTMQTGIDEYDTCREVKHLYREAKLAENIESKKYENMKHTNDLVKLKKQEKDLEDKKVATDELHQCILGEMDFQEKFRDKEYAESVRKMMKAYRAYFAAGLAKINQLESLIDQSENLPELERTYTLPVKDNTKPNMPVTPQKKIVKVFGTPLQDTMALYPNHTIPPICSDLLSILGPKVQETEGIFRLAGDTTAMTRLRKKYELGRGNQDLVNTMINNKEIDIHGVAGLLKSYIRELPEPLTGYKNYDALLELGGLPEAEGIRIAKNIVSQLPPYNAALMDQLLQLLNQTVTHSDVNKMGHMNIAIVFALNCIRSTDPNPMKMAIDSGKINKAFELLLRWYPQHLSNIFHEVGRRIELSPVPLPVEREPQMSAFVEKSYAPPPKRFGTAGPVSSPPVSNQPSSSVRPLPPPPSFGSQPPPVVATNPNTSYMNNGPPLPSASGRSRTTTVRNGTPHSALGAVLQQQSLLNQQQSLLSQQNLQQNHQNNRQDQYNTNPQQKMANRMSSNLANNPLFKKNQQQISYDDPFGDFEDAPLNPYK
ncbi:Rho GTPase-activating protein gacJJ [Acrasis kona]|uniref:Rho GTPase-activating protein gacJJ n=1 Tax=Acrasis kona TaxID=1008807 RepID=A0AAW2YWP3_9EUKA